MGGRLDRARDEVTIWQQLLAGLTAGSLGSAITFLLTLPQRRAVLSAQASKTEDEGTALVVKASAGLLEQAGKAVPALSAAVARLEAELKAERERGERLEAQVAADRAETAEVQRWMADAWHWMQRAYREITERGGSIDPPPQPPARCAVFRRPAPPAPTMPAR